MGWEGERLEGGKKQLSQDHKIHSKHQTIQWVTTLSGHNSEPCWPKWKTARYLLCWVEFQSPVPCLLSHKIFSCNSWLATVLWSLGNSRPSLALPLHFGGVFPVQLRGPSFNCLWIWYQSFKHLFSSSSVLSPKNSFEKRAKLGFLWWMGTWRRRPQAVGFLRKVKSWRRTWERRTLDLRHVQTTCCILPDTKEPARYALRSLPFLKSGCASYKILSQREAMSFPLSSALAQIFHCK